MTPKSVWGSPWIAFAESAAIILDAHGTHASTRTGTPACTGFKSVKIEPRFGLARGREIVSRDLAVAHPRARSGLAANTPVARVSTARAARAQPPSSAPRVASVVLVPSFGPPSPFQIEPRGGGDDRR